MLTKDYKIKAPNPTKLITWLYQSKTITERRYHALKQHVKEDRLVLKNEVEMNLF